MKNKMNTKIIFCLHVLLVLYSLSGVFSKLASQEQFLSYKFLFYYGCVLFLLGMYAIVWQQIIKRIDLTLAFANKAVMVIWGIVWGAVIFHEKIEIKMIVGAVIVICGVVLYSFADRLYEKFTNKITSEMEVKNEP